MKKLYQLNNYYSFRMFAVGILLLLSSNQLFADGSKDLYPSGAKGFRAYLRSSEVVRDQSYMFPTTGTHYVYAKAGERIALASSAQLAENRSAIQLYSPTGTQVVNNTSAEGLIANRGEEIRGPKLTVNAPSGGYAPVYYDVPTTGTGIYRVEFISRGDDDEPSPAYEADKDFVQKDNRGIMAWDVSVINSSKTNFVQGRVYTNVFNLSIGTGNDGGNGNEEINGNVNGFYGLLYVLTKDGFTYKVNNNGNNGYYFTFFANNNGFLDPTGSPIYKSLNRSAETTDVHDPRSVDTSSQVTQKIFYTLPANDLPVTSTGAVPGNSTWLKNTDSLPIISNIALVGVENTPGQISNKGGYVRFTTTAQGNYSITIKSTGSPSFVARSITSLAGSGENKIYWDGKDGAGVRLPSGTFPAEVSVQFQGGEVHFPFIDMEFNKNGFILELLDKNNLNNIVSDKIFWNDKDVRNATEGAQGPKGNYSDPKNNSHLAPTNSLGISSNLNGHIWAQGSRQNNGQFGDMRSIDTWTFIVGNKITVNTPIVVKIADLKISDITSTKSVANAGDEVYINVKVKNDGPDDVTGAPFSLELAVGFDPVDQVFFANSCGSENVALVYDAATRKYTSRLSLRNGCEITYSIKVKANTMGTAGLQNFETTIMRPNDVTDPDATNQDPKIPPTDPEYECSNNGVGGMCNNITKVVIDYSPLAICTESLTGSPFVKATASTPTSISTIQPGTTNGFTFDIFSLDNSFNININGITIANAEIQFQSSGTSGRNIRFVDGTQYEVNTPTIFNMTGTVTNPLVRVVISASGEVTMYGSKVSGGPLFPLELYGTAAFNTVIWNQTSSNTVVINQIATGPTRINGTAYGTNIIPCPCYKPAVTTGLGLDTKMGITALNRAGADNGNWPMVRKGAHLALEAKTKGFVPTRIANPATAILNPVDGMMVYDTTKECLSIYVEDAATPANSAWKCIGNQTCPE